MERLNYGAWLTGIYTTYSIASVIGENAKYPEKPIALFSQEEEALAKQQEKESQLFSAYAAMFNKNFEKKQT